MRLKKNCVWVKLKKLSSSNTVLQVGTRYKLTVGMYKIK